MLYDLLAIKLIQTKIKIWGRVDDTVPVSEPSASLVYGNPLMPGIVHDLISDACCAKSLCHDLAPLVATSQYNYHPACQPAQADTHFHRWLENQRFWIRNCN